MKGYNRWYPVASLAAALIGCGGSGGSGTTPIANSPPTFTVTQPDVARAGNSFRFEPLWDDPDGDPPLFSIENQPDWTSFDPNTGVLAGTPGADDVQIYRNITITISDGEFDATLPPFDLAVMHAPITRQSITHSDSASVTQTDRGFDVLGNTSLMAGGVQTIFNNADLQFEFDEQGNLIDLAGVTDLPEALTETLSLDASVSVQIGLFSGAEINVDPDIGPDSTRGILLRDDFLYFVYRFEAGVDLTIDLGGETSEVSLGVGPSADVYIVSDPTDPFFYYFGSLISGDVGFGYSLGSNIPYEPIELPEVPVEIAPLEGFDTGQAVLKGTFPFGFFGPFSFFEHVGTAVCSPPQLLDCEMPSAGGLLTTLGGELFLGDGIDESQQFKVGMNGSTAFEVSLLGFLDLFEYHLFDTAATVDIGTDLQQLAMLGVIDPQESRQPEWIPITPVPEADARVVASVFATMQTQYSADPFSEEGFSLEVTGGDFGLSMFGEFASRFPEARIAGQVEVDSIGMTLNGTVDDSQNPLTVAAIVNADGMVASVQTTFDITDNINTVVNDGFDAAIEAVNEAMTDLATATGNYNGAVSLNDFRAEIPGIIDNEIIPALNAVPQRVYDRVFAITRDGITDNQYCYTAVATVCADDVLDANAEAAASANTTRDIARQDVNAQIAELEQLRVEAERAQDTPQFRTALQNALNQAASLHSYRQSVLIRRDINFPSPIPDRTITFFNGNVVISPTFSTATRDDLSLAADNVDDIGPAQTVLIDTQSLVDSLPTEQAIEGARADVENGLQVIPTFNGVGYTVGSDFSQTVFVNLDDERIEAEFNPLDPATVVENIGRLIADSIVDN